MKFEVRLLANDDATAAHGALHMERAAQPGVWTQTSEVEVASDDAVATMVHLNPNERCVLVGYADHEVVYDPVQMASRVVPKDHTPPPPPPEGDPEASAAAAKKPGLFGFGSKEEEPIPPQKEAPKEAPKEPHPKPVATPPRGGPLGPPPVRK